MTQANTSAPARPVPVEWFNTSEAADYMSTTYNTLKAWRAFGTGPKYHCIGKRFVRYHKDDLDHFMRNSAERDGMAGRTWSGRRADRKAG